MVIVVKCDIKSMELNYQIIFDITKKPALCTRTTDI